MLRARVRPEHEGVCSSGKTVEGIKFEDGWCQIEYQSGEQMVRGWVPEGNVTDW